MRILCNVDQAASLARGIDAPTSTEAVEVDPATLSETERAVLAAVLWHGHDARWLGIQTEPDGIVRQHYADDRPERPSCYSNGSPTGPLVLRQSGIAGLREAIAALLQEGTAKHVANAAEVAERTRAADAALDAEIVPRDVPTEVGLLASGTVVTERSTWDWPRRVVAAQVPLPRVPDRSPGYASADARARYAAAQHEAQSRYATALAAAADNLRPQLAAELARRAEVERVTAAEYAALYARLPEALRARADAGFAGDEPTRAMRRLIRADAGYPTGYRGYADSDPATVLTDGQFERFEAVRAGAPAGAKVEALRVHDWLKTACDEHDEYDSDCDDCSREETAVRHLARVTWTRGGIEVRAAVEIGE